MTLTVRNARQNDSQRCMELLQSLASFTGGSTDPLAPEIFDQLLNNTRGEIFVAEGGGRILGMASVSYNLAMRYGGEYCQLEELIVDPAGRGQNIGGRLVEKTVEQAKLRGCAEYFLYLVATTEQNLPFYEKYGFKKVGSELRQSLRSEYCQNR